MEFRVQHRMTGSQRHPLAKKTPGQGQSLLTFPLRGLSRLLVSLRWEPKLKWRWRVRITTNPHMLQEMELGPMSKIRFHSARMKPRSSQCSRYLTLVFKTLSRETSRCLNKYEEERLPSFGPPTAPLRSTSMICSTSTRRFSTRSIWWRPSKTTSRVFFGRKSMRWPNKRANENQQ